MRKVSSLLLAVLSGAAMWLAFPDVGWWPMAVVSVALLHTALALGQQGCRRRGIAGRRAGAGHAGWSFLLGYIAGVTFFLPHTRWIVDATELVPWIALTLVLQAPFYGLFAVMWTWVHRLAQVRDKPWLHVVAFASLWVSAEQWRSQVPFGGFPWGRLAWSVASAPTGRAAWLGGTVLVSWMLAAVAATSVLLVQRLGALVRGGLDRTAWYGLVWPLVTIVGLVWGPALLPLPHDGQLEAVANPGATTPVEVPDRSIIVDAGTATAQQGVLYIGLVQGNVYNAGGDPVDNWGQVIDNHLAQVGELAQDIETRRQRGDAQASLDIVLWPEDAVGRYPAQTWGTAWQIEQSQLTASQLDAASLQVGAPMMIGTQEFPATGGRYNLALIWEPGQGITSRYAKRRPAPFGEYMPMRWLLERLSDQVARVTTDMIASDNPPLLVLDSTRLDRQVLLGVGICFEVAYDYISFEAVAQGAQMLVIPTNNASFGVSPQSAQQLQMTQMQAMATGRAAVQVSTNGVSAVVAPDGTVVARTGLFTADRVAAAIPLRTAISPAVAMGAAPSRIVSVLGPTLALLALVLDRLVVNRPHSRSRSHNRSRRR